MAEKSMTGSGKRPIDKKREAGGVTTLGVEGDRIVAMLSLGGRLLSVMQNGIYATVMADSVDPHLTDFDLPNVIAQKVLSYGSSSQFIGRTLLLGDSLFDTAYLGIEFDKHAAMRLAFEACNTFGGHDRHSQRDRARRQHRI
jgi:hypothetical protein